MFTVPRIHEGVLVMRLGVLFEKLFEKLLFVSSKNLKKCPSFKILSPEAKVEFVSDLCTEYGIDILRK